MTDLEEHYAALEALHDAVLVHAKRVGESTLVCELEVDYLADMFEPGTSRLVLRLQGCTRATWEPSCEPEDEGRSPSAELPSAGPSSAGPLSMGAATPPAVIPLEQCEDTPIVLSVEADAEGGVRVAATDGQLRLAYASLRCTLESGREIGPRELKRGAWIYWARWAADADANELGLSVRPATEGDFSALEALYRELLEFLAEFNPNVDPATPLQRDWLEKPDDLFPYVFELPSPGEEPLAVGFALVCGRKVARAVGHDADWCMYEFGVTEAARGCKVGTAAVSRLLERHLGTWSLVALEANTRAVAFWTRALGPFVGDSSPWTDEDGARFVRFRFESAVLPD